jgi:hypothetical protein
VRGKYDWRRLCELRKAQIEARRAARGRQLAMFDLNNDFRPAAERTTGSRHREPTPFAPIPEGHA